MVPLIDSSGEVRQGKARPQTPDTKDYRKRERSESDDRVHTWTLGCVMSIKRDESSVRRRS